MSENKNFDNIINSISHAMLNAHEEETKRAAELQKAKEDEFQRLKEDLAKELNEIHQAIAALNSRPGLTNRKEGLMVLQQQVVYTLQLYSNRPNKALKDLLDRYQACYHNLINEIKAVDRQMILGDNLTNSEAPLSDDDFYKDYNKPSFTQKQILFFMHQLKMKRFFLSDLSDTDFAKALNILTGMSQEKLRQNLNPIKKDEVEFSEVDRDKLKDILVHLNKEIEKVGVK